MRAAALRFAGAGLVGLSLSLALAGSAAAQFKADPWVADLDQLRDAMSARYANLEWQVERGLDLPQVYGQARRRIEAAPDEATARRAIERFLERFADGHLEIRWAPPAPVAPPPAAAAAPTRAPNICARLAYASPDSGAVAQRLPGYASLPKGDVRLPAGVVEIGGRRIGVLRIAAFDALAIPGFCEQAVAHARLKPDSPCDETCEAGVRRSAKDLFKAAMAAQIVALKAQKPAALLIDVADNGGGDDSALTLARMLTAKPLRGPRVGFLRTPEWGEELAGIQADIRQAMTGADPAVRPRLALLDQALDAGRAETGQSCDRGLLWRRQPVSCSLVVTNLMYASGLSPSDAAWAGDQAWTALVSKWTADAYAKPIWTGPLLILTDGNSASSTELFAAMLQDARAATVIGAPTAGAGCGHMTSARPVRLINSGGMVSMPDCLRLRADGSNEVAGVEPDVLIGFRRFDTPKERVGRLAPALPAAVSRALARRN